MGRFSFHGVVPLAAAVGLAATLFVQTPREGAAEGRGASPTPTPTPAGQTLADLGSPIRLDVTATPSPYSERLFIDNTTIRAVAGQSELTTSRPSSSPTPSVIESRRATREIWRGEYRNQVGLILSLRERMKALDERLPDLWLQFYSEDDPARREDIVRRDLDGVIQERFEAEVLLAAAESALEEMRAAADAAGAEPGWFRDLDRMLRRDGE